MGSKTGVYYPGPWPDWDVKKPEDVGMSSAALKEAADFSITNETEIMRDLALDQVSKLGEPYPEMIGPTKDRGDVCGVVVKNGYIVAEWGDPHRVDMTFSATKSYLSVTTGIAYDRGLIRDIDHKVGDYVKDGGFDSEHNSGITWRHLLNQTSDWSGELWGKYDWADRPEGDRVNWKQRPLHTPGSWWKYNDVRVNRLALSTLRVLRKPLPGVLRESIMNPIGASPFWEWYGYDNAWLNIDGAWVQSVTGGGHWGGGLWISARDHARFGLLSLRNGNWNGKQLLSEEWIKLAKTPTGSVFSKDTPANSSFGCPSENQIWYGFMNWMLNTKKVLLPDCPESSFFHAGNGANIIWMDPEHELVVVIRWIKRDALNDFLKRVIAAVK